jgi:hypothetical protein
MTLFVMPVMVKGICSRTDSIQVSFSYHAGGRFPFLGMQEEDWSSRSILVSSPAPLARPGVGQGRPGAAREASPVVVGPGGIDIKTGHRRLPFALSTVAAQTNPQLMQVHACRICFQIADRDGRAGTQPIPGLRSKLSSN